MNLASYSPYNAAVNSRRIITILMSLLLCLAATLIFPATGYAKTPPAKPQKWVGSWSTSPQLVEPNNMPPAPGLSENTLRQVVCVSIGGKKLRMKFSNEYGKTPLTLRAVEIAASKGNGAIDAATSKTLYFNGKPEVTLMPGATLTSDPVSFNLKPRMELAITLAFGEVPPALTGHPGSRTTSYLLGGNHPEADADFTGAVKTDHWYVINGIDVEASASAAAVAVIGDSITDGRGSGTNKQNRWPDVLAENLLNKNPKQQTGVLNLGIGGNCVLRGGLGPTALSRFNRDILQQSGVRWVIIFEGVNDLGSTRDSLAAAGVAQKLIAAYDTMINAAHAQGLKVYGATITPIKKSFYYASYREAARNTINTWIRTSGHFDAVIDFDKVVTDPATPSTLLAGAQSGDYLHPSEPGYQMMGKAVNVALFM